ncbi:hypothetical protein JZ751_016111 [Albula glossodonta]|uniref:Uncharacterized protein n=1 Tax=Albula glossodonta TaxID=121402 RepID=A0A8T2NRC0_9TELE|nr:hypothetical protein JZ751_016111 [Albula glossodonta]
MRADPRGVARQRARRPRVMGNEGGGLDLEVLYLRAADRIKNFKSCLNLKEELRKLREETNVETLKQELDKERGKRLDLEQKMNEVLKSRLEDSPPQPPPKAQSPAANGTAMNVNRG